MGAVTLVDQDRQWIKAAFGPLVTMVPRQGAFCSYTILQEGVMQIPDTLLDPRFVDHPQVISAPFVRFYAGVALQARSGLAVGTICVMDSRPRRLMKAQLKALEIAASYMAAQLEVRLGVLHLLEERRIAKEQADEITRASQRQKDLSALLVHDLRSPLAAMTANSHYLASEATLTAEQQAAIQDIIVAGDKLTGMVTDLLQVSRAEDGQLIVRNKSPVSLAEVIEFAISLTRASATERRVQVSFDSRPCAGLVDGDKELLLRVITNLLDNAYRYSPTGSTVRVELSVVDDFAVIRVIDHGPGIPPSQRQLVFDKYFQVHHEAPTRPTFGLGLSFCKIAVEAHLGSIEVEEVAEGCSFKIALPNFGNARSHLIVTTQSAHEAAVEKEASVQAEADSVVVLARHLADEVLRTARNKEDDKLDRDDASSEARDAVKQERVEADSIVDDQRTDADAQLQKERGKP